MPANLLRLGFSLFLLALAGCVTPVDAQSTPEGSPPLRADLDSKWLLKNGQVRWPEDNGFTNAPVLIVLPAGMLIDRFGPPTGHFFSPKGAGFAQRATPYDCARTIYHVYAVERPLLVWTGTALPWFDEVGGATQLQTDASVASLLADKTLIAISDTGPKPCPTH